MAALSIDRIDTLLLVHMKAKSQLRLKTEVKFEQ